MREVPTGPIIARSALIVWSAAMIGGSFIPGESVPAAAMVGWDKLAHFIGFVVLGGLTLAAFHRRSNVAWITIMYGLIMGLATESAQLGTVGRTFSLADIAADIIGTVVVVIPTLAWQRGRASADQG